MPAEHRDSERGVVLAVVLMVLAALSLMAVAGKGDTALQWLQVRNAREHAEAVRLADTGIGRALAVGRFRLDAAQYGRYCRIASRCVEWTVRFMESTAVPAGLTDGHEGKRALHFEVASVGTAGKRARAAVAVGFLLIAPGEPESDLPGVIRVCRGENDCPENAAGPPVRRYWREARE